MGILKPSPSKSCLVSAYKYIILLLGQCGSCIQWSIMELIIPRTLPLLFRVLHLLISLIRYLLRITLPSQVPWILSKLLSQKHCMVAPTCHIYHTQHLILKFWYSYNLNPLNFIQLCTLVHSHTELSMRIWSTHTDLTSTKQHHAMCLTTWDSKYFFTNSLQLCWDSGVIEILGDLSHSVECCLRCDSFGWHPLHCWSFLWDFLLLLHWMFHLSDCLYGIRDEYFGFGGLTFDIWIDIEVIVEVFLCIGWIFFGWESL